MSTYNQNTNNDEGEIRPPLSPVITSNSNHWGDGPILGG